jgi:hypothetical protein
MYGNSLDCNSCFAAVQLGQLLFVYMLMFMSDLPFLVCVNKLALLALLLLNIGVLTLKRLPVVVVMSAFAAKVFEDGNNGDTADY